MLTKDYIMRMIETLSMMLQKVLLMKESKNISGGYEEINKTSKELLGFELSLLQSLPDNKIIELFSLEKDTSAPRLYVLGVLFKEKASLDALGGKHDESDLLKLKSLAMLLESYLVGQKQVFKDHASLVQEILQSNGNDFLTLDTLDRLFQFYELTNQYGKAEDVLFEIIHEDPEYVTKGILFYERLLQKNDDELLLGNLPRPEVEEAYDDLKSRQKL